MTGRLSTALPREVNRNLFDTGWGFRVADIATGTLLQLGSMGSQLAAGHYPLRTLSKNIEPVCCHHLPDSGTNLRRLGIGSLPSSRTGAPHTWSARLLDHGFVVRFRIRSWHDRNVASQPRLLRLTHEPDDTEVASNWANLALNRWTSAPESSLRSVGNGTASLILAKSASASATSSSHCSTSSATNLFFARSRNLVVLAICSSNGGTDACDWAFFKVASNTFFSSKSPGPKFIKAPCNLATRVDAARRTSFGFRGRSGVGTLGRGFGFLAENTLRPGKTFVAGGQRAAGGLGPRITCNHPLGNSTVLHPLVVRLTKRKKETPGMNDSLRHTQLEQNSDLSQ